MTQSLAYAPRWISPIVLLTITFVMGAVGQWGGYREMYGWAAGWGFLAGGAIVGVLVVALLGALAERRALRGGGGMYE